LLDWESPRADRKIKKRIQNLSRDLRGFFGIEDPPFRPIRKKPKGWQARFELSSRE
jgi:hypothetical protein